ncbi:hypothetical protein OE88DRAFT_1737357 [Heliocybe sulcata]|uniref:Uncharacterized protein n=1 Tax=Heliocybe sulcata TaxID=5364 RepID=A0A5C3N610_9AGAM|nr:hypothetical protein OE88DRAFT_1737357 [Heliocybe sulcata]
MAPRKSAFTVFVDENSVAESSTTKVASKGGVLRSSTTSITSNSISTITTLASLAAEHEKENIDPLTGLRAGAPAVKGKKRKAALAPKAIQPPQPLQCKPVKAIKEVEKKKKPVKSKESAVKSKGSKTRKPKASKSRSPSLPVVAEDCEAEGRVEVVDADTRCYELTVLPLADVTQAYEDGSPTKRRALMMPLTPSKLPRDTSLEPEIGDSFIPGDFEFGMKPRVRGLSVEPEAPLSFSTPERKQIYSNFTFSSPSKSAERYRRVRERSLSPEEAALEL